MTRHSKNNTAGSCFTYAERQKLDYGTKRQRLGNDSKQRFNSCGLCLQTATMPMICDKGHLYCKECILSNILAQKREIEKAKQQKLEEIQKNQEADAQKEQDENEAKIEKFKREQEELSSIPEKKIKIEESKHLPSFWVPSETPAVENSKNASSSSKTSVECPYESHPILMKKLISINFQLSEDNEICAACRKELSNNIASFAYSICGHVICGTCSKQVPKKEKKIACLVCDVNNRELIQLVNEGTGFSSKGPVIAEKFDFAFQ